MRDTQVHYSMSKIMELHEQLIQARERTRELRVYVKKLAKEYYDFKTKGWFLTKPRRNRLLDMYDDEALCFCRIANPGSKSRDYTLQMWWNLMNAKFATLETFTISPVGMGVTFAGYDYERFAMIVSTAEYWTEERVNEAITHLERFDVAKGEFRD